MADNISKILNFLPKPAWGKQESKSCSQSGGRDISERELTNLLAGYGLGTRFGWQWLQAAAAWAYYKSVSVVAQGVDLGSEAFETIEPQIFDTKDKTFHKLSETKVPQNQMLELLNKPNTDQSGIEYRGSLARSYQVTGNMYQVGLAINEKSPFVDLIYVNPIDIEINPDMKGGVQEYIWYKGSGQIVFKAIELDGDIRYFTDDMRWELWHTKRFNPDKSSRSNGALSGMSPLNPVFLEIEQIMSSNVHNWSLLENGARPSGALLVDAETNLTDEQILRLKSDIRNFYQGSNNAGNVMYIEGGKDFKELSINNKDMDFANLLKGGKRQVFNNLKVPLPLVEGDSQTFNNFGQADAILYTRNVIPFSDLFYTELNRFGGRRYDKNKDNRFKIWYDTREIPALQVVMTEIAKQKLSTGMFTFDEGRALLDLSNLASGGDTVYQPANLLPVGQVEQQKIISTTETKARFIDIMKKEVNVNGERKYTDEFIEREAEKKYGNSQ